MLSFDRPDLWWIVLILAAAFLLSLRSEYGFPRAAGLRRILAALRGTALLLLLFALLQPSVSCSYSRMVPAELAVLVDTSLSMSAPASSSSRLRYGLQELERLRRRDDRFTFRHFAFGDRLRTVPTVDHLEAKDSASDFRQAVLTLARNVPSHSFRGILLISDGRFTLDDSAVSALRTLKHHGIPVIPLRFPADADRPDTSVRLIPPADEEIPIDRPAVFEAEFLRHPATSAPLQVSFLVDGTVIASKTVTPAAERGVVRFEYTPTSEGVRDIAVAVRPSAEDAFAANDRDSLLVRCVRGRRMAVLLAGSASWEYAFLKRQLENDPSLRTSATFRKAETPLAVPAGIDKADLVVLCGIAPEDLPPSLWTRLRDRIRTGKTGLLLLAGPGRSVFSHPPKTSDLADLLPFEPLSTPPLRGSFQVQLSPQGSTEPVMLLEDQPGRNSRAWASLPPFTTVHRVRPKPGTVVLATAAGSPVMGFGPDRRIFFIAASATWRWAFLNLPLNDDHERYRTFYRRLLAELAASTSSQDRIATDRLNYDADSPVRIVSQGPKSAELSWEGPEGLSGRIRLSPSPLSKDRFEGTFLPPRPGDYLLKTPEGLSTRIRVGRPGDEWFDIRPNPAVLERIAAISGHLRPEDLDASPVRKSFVRKRDLTDSLLTLLLVVGLLASEWILRKTQGWP